MKKILLMILALGGLGGAEAAAGVEIGAGGGIDKGISVQLIMHAPKTLGPVGLRGGVAINNMSELGLNAGLTHPLYHRPGGFQSYIYGGGAYQMNVSHNQSRASGKLYADFGLELSYPVAENLRLTADLGWQGVHGQDGPKALVGFKTSF